MIAEGIPQVPQQADDFPPWTEEERESMFQSVVWLYDQQNQGTMNEYEGKYVAIVNSRIADSDADKDELYRRLAACGTRTAIVRHIPGPNDFFDW